MELDRKLGFRHVEFVQVETREGNGVLHVLWAWKGSALFIVRQAWLSETWLRLHGAPIVWIERVGGSKKDGDCVGRYLVAQYCANQKALVRLSWSWWSMPVALASGWETLKRLASDTYRDDERKRWYRVYHKSMAEVVAAWEHLLDGGTAMLGETLLEVRARQVVEVF